MPELILVLLIVIVLGAGAYVLLPRIAPAGAGAAIATPRITPRPTQPATAQPVVEFSLEPPVVHPPTAPTEPMLYGAGDQITVTSNGSPWAIITVSKVNSAKTLTGDYYDDVPAAGHVYLQAWVTYEALRDGVSFNPFDWQVFVDGVAVQNFTVVLNGPKPELSSGTLPKGRKAEGWVVYEVPAKGRVLFSFGGSNFTNQGPVFEVEVRPS